MDIRYIGTVAAMIGISGCSGEALNVGTTGIVGAGTGFSSGATAGASSGGTVAPAECDAGLSTGAGFSAAVPTECASAPGTAHAVTTASDVISLLVGEWRSCGPYILPDGNIGIQFTPDGRFMALTEADDGSLVPVGSPGVTVGTAGASGSTTGGTMVSPGGTFSVVDGSSTYGPGTFELHLNPDSGGIFEGQITVTDSPRAFVFQPPNSRGLAYVPPAPWTPRANVCSACGSPPGGTPIDQNNPSALSTDVVGRWIWCTGSGGTGAGGLVMGMEFTADGAWYDLIEAQDGTLSRSTNSLDNGTFKFTQEMMIGPSASGSASYPMSGNLELNSQEGQSELTEAVVTQNPRSLWLSGGFSSTDGVATYDFSYLLPLP